MRARRKLLPMVEPEDFTKYKYICDGEEYTFAQLCCHFGLKYMAVWWKVAKNGMTVYEAITTCMDEPRDWGVTYSNGSLPIMSEKERQASITKRVETWKKNMKEKGQNNNGK